MSVHFYGVKCEGVSELFEVLEFFLGDVVGDVAVLGKDLDAFF
jgi:hypothetical protein